MRRRKWVKRRIQRVVERLRRRFARPRSEQDRQRRIRTLYARYREQGFAEVPDLGPDQLSTLDSPVLIDVREPYERAVSMLPGALSLEDFERDAEAYRGRILVPYCTIGARSGVVTRRLRAAGYDARNLAGSILAWTYTGRALERDGQPTRAVHTYGSSWDLTADGYDAVW